MKVETDAPLYYRYLTELEITFRLREHPLSLSDVAALGSHFGEFEVSEEELDLLVKETPTVDISPYGAHHKVWIGKWELGMSWDKKLVYAKEVRSSNPKNLGTCYEDAWRFLIKQGEGFLVHGSVQLTEEGRRVNHAWVELTIGWAWEPQTKSYYTIEEFKVLSPIEEYRYTAEEAAIMLARVGKHGPWSEDQRRQYIYR